MRAEYLGAQMKIDVTSIDENRNAKRQHCLLGFIILAVRNPLMELSRDFSRKDEKDS